MPFPCDQCGCCRRKVMKPAGIEHLCGLDPLGICVNYDPAIGCTIYATRPEVCSVDRVYHSHGFDERMSLAVYYGVSRALCQQLQAEAGWTQTRTDEK